MNLVEQTRRAELEKIANSGEKFPNLICLSLKERDSNPYKHYMNALSTFHGVQRSPRGVQKLDNDTYQQVLAGLSDPVMTDVSNHLESVCSLLTTLKVHQKDQEDLERMARAPTVLVENTVDAVERTLAAVAHDLTPASLPCVDPLESGLERNRPSSWSC